MEISDITMSIYFSAAVPLEACEDVWIFTQAVTEDIRDGKEQGIGGSGASALKADNSKAVHRYYIRHDRMCEHMEPLVDTYEEIDGIYYCISKPLPVETMHKMGHHRKEKGREMFFAALAE